MFESLESSIMKFSQSWVQLNTKIIGQLWRDEVQGEWVWKRFPGVGSLVLI